MNDAASKIRSALLQRFIDGQFHSGQVLADELGVSRTAVQNHVAALVQLGVDIFSVKGKGYRLSRHIDLLCLDKIKAAMSAPHFAPISLFAVVDSTNTLLKDHIDSAQHGEIIIAEAQTAGRGRRGKAWISPFGASLYLSLCWRFEGGYQQIGGLSLFVGYCVVKALETLSVDGLGLKWPNDLYRHGRKLGGILVEVDGQIGSEVACIIGIGLNVDLGEQLHKIDQPVSDLVDCQVERNQLAGAILDSLILRLPQFAAHGLLPVVDEWNRLDVFADKMVTLSGQQSVSGVNRGIDNSGALQLETEQGITAMHGGEVSLRATK